MRGGSGGIGLFLKRISLKPVKDMKFTFDPYHSSVKSLREVLYFVNSPKMIETNPDVVSKVDIKSDRSSPEIFMKFADGHKVLFKTEYLTTFDIARKLAKLCQERQPKEDTTSAGIFSSPTATASGGKKTAGGAKKKPSKGKKA